MSDTKYTAAELLEYWLGKCELCGWEGLSRDAAGGGQIADSGDYDDCLCPICWERDIEQSLIDIEDH